MELSGGTRLGPYEILAPLGRGPASRVYHARDTQRGRDVAIKVLLRGLPDSSKRREKLEHDVRAAIRLQHPHIRAQYDLESRQGVEFLVMEYVEGETLAARLEKGPLSIHNALGIAIQMAEALGAAHAHGVIHGGLKPTNILLTDSGVKVLDFGQSPTREPIPLAGEAPGYPAPSQAADGEIFASALGCTAPEQMDGQDADAKSDIFAFGAILYEMASGRKAFPGTYPPGVMAAVLGSEPPAIASLRPETPAALDRLVRACLAKDPGERLQSAHDLEMELKWIRDRISVAGAPAAGNEHRRSVERLAWWTAIGALVLAVGMIVAYTLLPARHLPAPMVQAVIKLPEHFELSPGGTSIAFSPGGTRLAVVGSKGDERPRLWLRAAEGAEWKALAGTEGASFPFWSPDGGSIAFFANHMLERIDLSSGTVLTICAAPGGRGGTWNQQGTIVFAPVPSGGLYRVPAAGGTPIQVSVPASAAISHRLPHFLPGGRRLLFLAKMNGPSEQKGIYVLDIETGQTRLLLHGDGEARYIEPGYLAFLRNGNLMVQSFSAAGLQLRGQPVIVARDVRATEGGAGEFSFSKAGLLLYQADSRRPLSQLTWFSPEGKALGTVGKPEEFASMAVSPDGRWAAVKVEDEGRSSPIWIYGLETGVRRLLTPAKGSFSDPVWSPDGSRVAYDDGTANLYMRAAIGASKALKLSSGRPAKPTAWSPDGQLMAADVPGNNGLDIWILPARGEQKPYPLLSSPYNENGGTFSADGRWFSYMSDESGVKQLYVIPFPGGGAPQQISTIGVVTGGWVPGRLELAYETPGGRLFAVNMRTRGKMLELGKPRQLLGGYRVEADVQIAGLHCFTPGGKRLLLPVPVPGNTETGTLLTLVTNWQAALEGK